MNNPSENTQRTVVGGWSDTIGKHVYAALTAAAVLCTVSCSDSSQAIAELTIDPDLGQAVFATPEDAANAFVLAVANDDETLLGKVLGADFREVLPLDNIDGKDLDNFIAAWEKHNTLLPQGHQTMLLAVGEDEWTLPIPIVEGDPGWYFDIEAGLERMRIRRIGRNELATMQAVLAYYDAQREYAEQDRNGNGLLEYARHLVSTPGSRDGLYWEDKSGDSPSPLGPLLADKTPGVGYHGYFYRILEAQGAHAKGGAYSYLIDGQMRSGFAVIAWPVEYGETGVMSFMVSHAGIVYEQDLGPDSASIAKAMQAYDPGPGWIPVQEVNTPGAAAEQ
jgi:hypothetical protein